MQDRPVTIAADLEWDMHYVYPHPVFRETLRRVADCDPWAIAELVAFLAAAGDYRSETVIRGGVQ